MPLKDSAPIRATESGGEWFRTQITDTLLLVQPDSFGFNPQTARSNTFQHKPSESLEQIQEQAQREFGSIIETLNNAGVRTLVLPSPAGTVTPDAVFPNNWVTTHEDGTIALYPMYTQNRRAERQPDALIELLAANGFEYRNIIDMTPHENEGRFLEATGSLVLDRVNNIAFAVESPRTHQAVVDDFAGQLGFEPVFFHAIDKDGVPVYHTNVVMAVGEGFVVLCADAIPDPEEKTSILAKIEELSYELIRISLDQMAAFCGNVLHIRSTDGTPKIVMSQTAHDNFTQDQITRLKKYGEPLVFEMGTIEAVGGGSARCVIAEIFLPRKS